MQLQRRADGTMVLRLSSPRPINDPFVDLVVDANWSAGHLVRSYTLLLDPPSLRKAPAAVTAAPQVQAAAPRAAAPAARPEPTPRPRAAAPAPAPAPAAARAPEAGGAGSAGGQVTVHAGDTAGRIAAAHRPGGVSLDQMLVAMMRANPDAFVQGNVNRLRSGAVLQMPGADEAQATAAPEARRIIATQSRDFNEFRRRLADAAPSARQGPAERTASGTVQAQVQESQAAAGASPDKLTLSKGSVGTGKAEAQLARGKQSSQDAARMAELSRNLTELNQLGGAAAATAGAGAASAAAGLSVATPPAAAPAAAPAPAPAPEAAATPPVAAATPASTPAEPPAAAPAQDAASAAQPQAAAAAVPASDAPAATSPAPAPAAAPKPAPAPPPADLEEPSFLDSLLGDPLLAGGALALILALLGYGGWRALRSRRAQGPVDSSFLDSRKAPDSFFGASGGQRVDTASSELSTGSSSSMSYSPSQLDAGDVDPVAEADVYLAYGRDLQAEEILKEAQRHHPDRVSIPAKLAEIHAKRQDRRALEATANEVLRLTGGRGPEWARVAELGRTLEPGNTLYQSAAAAAVMPAAAAALAQPPAPAADHAPAGAPESELPDLDLDLDFDLDLQEAPPVAAAPSTFAAAAAAAQALQATPAAAPEQAAESPHAAEPEALAPPPAGAADLEFALGDLDLPGGTWEASHPAVEPAAAAAGSGDFPTEPSPLDLDDAGLDFSDSDRAALAAHEPAASQPAPLEFDLGDLSLDLGLSEPAALTERATLPGSLLDAPAGADASVPEDPLATKLALAEEFNTIGDPEGARALVEEVLAESSGELRARAQRLLAQLP